MIDIQPKVFIRSAIKWLLVSGFLGEKYGLSETQITYIFGYLGHLQWQWREYSEEDVKEELSKELSKELYERIIKEAEEMMGWKIYSYGVFYQAKFNAELEGIQAELEKSHLEEAQRKYRELETFLKTVRVAQTVNILQDELQNGQLNYDRNQLEQERSKIVKQNKVTLTSAFITVPKSVLWKKLIEMGHTQPGDYKPDAPNQDNGFADPHRGILLVADGVGGNAGGEIASGIARDKVNELLTKEKIASFKTREEAKEYLAKVALMVHQAIVERAESDPSTKGMGTTFSLLLIWEDPSTGRFFLIGVNIGDSRFYVCRANGSVEQLSKDDSYLNYLINIGVEKNMTPEQAEVDPRRNIITDSLGDPNYRFDLKPHQIIVQELQKGDIAFAVSDGISDNLGNRYIENIAKNNADPQELVQRLRSEAARITIAPQNDYEIAHQKIPDDMTVAALRVDLAMQGNNRNPVVDKASLTNLRGGIDFNAANLNMQIKRDGRGVPLPLAQQDMDQLNRIQGFEPEIIEIKPAVNLPILSELQQKLQSS